MCIRTEETPYKCDTCGAQFTHIRTLNMHVCIDIGDKLYKCDICGAQFTHRNALTMLVCNQSMD